MPDLTLVESLLDGAPVVSDVEFGESFHAIASIVEQGQFADAVPLIESSLREGVLDVRFIMYDFFAAVSEDGLKRFLEIFPLLNRMFGESFEQLSPSTKRERHAEKGLIWFLGRQLKAFEGVNRAYKQKDAAPIKKLTDGVTYDEMCEIEDFGNALRKTLLERWEQSQAVNQLMNMLKSMRELSKTVAEMNTEEKEESSGSLFSGFKKKEKKKEKEVAPPVEEKRSTSIPASALTPSPALEMFYKKIQAFKTLVERGDYQKASVIAEDVEQKLDNFNPVIYFPKLFIEYYSLYAQCADSIEGSRSMGPNRLLQKLYDADLDTFIDWK